MPNTTSPVASQSIDRDSASEFNPLIGFDVDETMQRVERAVSDIGYLISVADETGLNLDTKNMFRLFEVACIALRFEIEARKNGSAADDPCNTSAISMEIEELSNSIAYLASKPETDAAATVGLIHATTRRAALRTKLAEMESRSSIDSLDEIIVSFLRSADTAETEAIVHSWAESGGLRDMLVALDGGVTK